MPKSALMFGSIGTIMETSDIQRRAYNQALKEAGLGWNWDPVTYADLLEQSGGKDRLNMLARSTGQPLSAGQIDAIHARKTEIACAEVIARSLELRPGVADLVENAKVAGMKVAFVTSTYRANVDAILAAAGDRLTAADFDCITTRDDVQRGKPAPDVYEFALKAVGVAASDAIAIEDTAVSVMSAKRAGIAVIATPGALTSEQDFWQADLVVDALLDAAGKIDARVEAMLGR